MNIKEINAKSILRKHKKIDSWFVSRYGMNLYRGCVHNCVYCDGRAEKYQVKGNFGCDVEVKINAVKVLNQELDLRRKRVPLKPGYIMMGGGVGDSYQPVEERYKLTRRALNVVYHYRFPVHVLTKSTLVERDLDVLKKINERTKAMVSFSFSSADDEISRVFEPGVPLPSERFETIKKFKKQGITCGMFLMPVIPFVTDKPEIIHDTIKKANDAGVDFIIFSGMTLKDGRQKDYFMDVLRKYYPDLLVEYNLIYKADRWGGATPEYYHSIHQTFNSIVKKFDIPIRVPSMFFKDFVSKNDLVVVILEQMDYLLKSMGRKSPYGFAAYSISKINEPLSNMKFCLRDIKGVGPTTEKVIQEILETDSSSYYEKLLLGK